MKDSYKTLLVWLVLIALFVVMFKMMGQGDSSVKEIKFSQFVRDVDTGVKMKDVVIRGNAIEGKYAESGMKFKTYGLVDSDLLERLQEHDIDYSIQSDEQSLWPTILASWLPMLLIFLLFIMFLRQLQGGAGKAMSFGKARVRLVDENKEKITFKDVAGIEEAKEEVQEIVEFLREPKKFTRLGGRIPAGVLLVGPPGTGKTLLAKAIAGEAGVPFFSISGSDFVEMFVGVGASRVRDLFEQGKKNAPCIIFIDEIDAVGRQRGAGLGGGHDEREQTLNQLLVEMDGFDSNQGIIVMAATNRPDILDPALLRPGRFDRQIVVHKPDVRGRKAILEVHVNRKSVPLSDDVDLEVIAKGTPGFSGADLENLVNEAALIAARRDADRVAMADFEQAKDKILMGVERKSMILTEKDKKVTAYHEAGHALVAMKVEGEKDPVHKVTIIPRGQALGLTQQLPSEDRWNITREYALNRMAVLLGGRIAEELVFGQPTTGAGNDLERCTDLARKMVCDWGMSEKLGPLTFGRSQEEIFLGRELAMHKDYSEETARMIDEEIKNIVMGQYERTRQILTQNMSSLKAVAKALLEHETLTARELENLVNGGSHPSSGGGLSAGGLGSLPPLGDLASTKGPVSGDDSPAPA